MNTAKLTDPIWDSRNDDEPVMPTQLPGEQKTDTPPLPNTIPGTRAKVPVEWDDFRRVTAAVFDVLDREGKAAADALMAWVNARRK